MNEYYAPLIFNVALVLYKNPSKFTILCLKNLIVNEIIPYNQNNYFNSCIIFVKCNKISFAAADIFYSSLILTKIKINFFIKYIFYTCNKKNK